MIKKFIALSLAVLVMASHMVSAYAYDNIPKDIPFHDSIDQWTENGVTGRIYTSPNNPNYQTYCASTQTTGNVKYIYAQIFAENAVNNANIDTSDAFAGNWDNIAARANATYGYYTHVRITSIHKVGSSEANITTAFGLRKIYTQ